MMSQNIEHYPYLIQLKDNSTGAVHLATPNLGIQYDPNIHNLATFATVENPQLFINSEENTGDTPQESLKVEPTPVEVPVADSQECVCVQIVYPQEFNLIRPISIKRGRPKKRKVKEITELVRQKNEPIKAPKSARTRSGRLVKLPKHIEADFKKIEITADEQDLEVSDFKRFEEKENTKIRFTELKARKRKIAAQYRCPKCLKAYLGKNKMIQHLKKYPDHGPLPEHYQEFNFDVWNYLFEITQKCKSGQRGLKFCEELSNLLHNVQLLKSALFKSVTDNNKNCVQIDKVLGNAIGLSPGKYKFDENELYKDVTVLQLITNSEFFKPNTNITINENEEIKEEEEILPDFKIDDDVTEIIEEFKEEEKSEDVNMLENEKDNKICDDALVELQEINYTEKSIHSLKQMNSSDNDNPKDDEPHPIALHHAVSLSDNLLLPTLPNTRTTVDELILSTVDDNTSNLLDNSASSDEVMNVDQFVNERFKKIIEPDIELSNTSLNLDLPGLDLFQFHTS